MPPAAKDRARANTQAADTHSAGASSEIGTEALPNLGASPGNAATSSGLALLKAVAKNECVYVAGGQPPTCPREWPRKPESWCGACLARVAIRRGF